MVMHVAGTLTDTCSLNAGLSVSASVTQVFDVKCLFASYATITRSNRCLINGGSGERGGEGQAAILYLHICVFLINISRTQVYLVRTYVN